MVATFEGIGIDAGAASSTGLVRSQNQDAWLVRPRLYVVADGMGGHAAGDRAAALAVAAMSALADTGVFGLEALLEAIGRANDSILAEGAAMPAEAGMGTTLTGVAVVPVDGVDSWVVFNVGDSRVYADTGSGLAQVTVDHSQIQRLIDAGVVGPEEAETHPLSNVITRSLGRPRAPEPDYWVIPMAPGQVFLACSDGVPLELGAEQIAGLVGGSGPADERARRLVAATDAAGGRDNSTAVVVLT